MNNYLELLYLVSFTGILAVAYSYLLSGQILSASPGNNRMQEIAEAIQIGAKAYLNRQYKKYIKDVVSGTLERIELIEETIVNNLERDINLKKTDKLLKIILFAAVFELMYKHSIPKKVVISEYVKASEFFLEKAQISYLNAILDKLSKLIRKT